MIGIVRSSFASAVVGVLVLASSRHAAACSCAPSGPPCQNAFLADAVFAGTVRRITPLPNNRPPHWPGELLPPEDVRVDFEEVVAFRGGLAATLSVTTAASVPGCGYPFKRGERYLVYATRSDDGDGTGLSTSHCSRTRRLVDAGEDLRFLQTLSAPHEARGLIFGTVEHQEWDLAARDVREYGAVADVLVSVRGARAAVDVWTDSQGHYEARVPSGEYEVSLFPPAGLSNRHQTYPIELRDPRACFVADFWLRFDSRITGVVTATVGGLLDAITVEAIPAETVGRSWVQPLRATADAGGRFEFIEVPPGRYVVGVDLTPRVDAGVVFPATFHPGTGDPAAATIVDVEGGEEHDIGPMTLPAPRRTFRLSGVVLFEDGSPAARANVSLFDGSVTDARQVASSATDTDGSFSLVVHEGPRYTANASYWDEANRRHFSGFAGAFVVAGSPGPLRIVLRPTQ